MVSLKRGVLSKPFFSASCDIAIRRGRTVASWCFSCGVILGDKPLAIFSNSALVMMVLQSAGFLDADAAGALAAGAPSLPPAGFCAGVFGAGGHTPLMVSTGASGGTAAGFSAGAAGA